MSTTVVKPAFLAAIDGDMKAWTPLQSTPATLEQHAKSVSTPADSIDFARFAFRLELIVQPPKALLQLSNWTNVVGAVIDLESPPGEMPADVVHAEILTRLGKAHAATPLLATQVGYHVRFLLSTPPTATHELFMERVVGDAERMLKSTGVVVSTNMEISSVDTFRRDLIYLERMMRRLAR